MLCICWIFARKSSWRFGHGGFIVLLDSTWEFKACMALLSHQKQGNGGELQEKHGWSFGHECPWYFEAWNQVFLVPRGLYSHSKQGIKQRMQRKARNKFGQMGILACMCTFPSVLGSEDVLVSVHDNGQNLNVKRGVLQAKSSHGGFGHMWFLMSWHVSHVEPSVLGMFLSPRWLVQAKITKKKWSMHSAMVPIFGGCVLTKYFGGKSVHNGNLGLKWQRRIQEQFCQQLSFRYLSEKG